MGEAPPQTLALEKWHRHSCLCGTGVPAGDESRQAHGFFSGVVALAARTMIRAATSPSSVVLNATVTRAFAFSLPSIFVSGLMMNVRFSVLPKILRDTVILLSENWAMVPEKNS